MLFGRTFSLLSLEGFLLQRSLTQGLTALRAATVDDKGSFYSAFFLLSIGLERLMKVVFVVDHMARHSLTPPSDQALRNRGHDLRSLFEYLASLGDRGPNPLTSICRSGIAFRILTFLSNFAQTSRYYNLSSLTGNARLSNPLSEWQGILTAILTDDVPLSEKQRAHQRSLAVALDLWTSSVVIRADLDGAEMTVFDAALQPQLHDLAAGYAVYHVLELVEPIKELLEGCVAEAHKVEKALSLREMTIPYMGEFLDFVWLDKDYVLAKNEWP